MIVNVYFEKSEKNACQQTSCDVLYGCCKVVQMIIFILRMRYISTKHKFDITISII